MPRDRERSHSRSRTPRRRSNSPRRKDHETRRGRHDGSPRRDSDQHDVHRERSRPGEDAGGHSRKDPRYSSPRIKRSPSPIDKAKRNSRSRSPPSKRRRRSQSGSRERDRRRSRSKERRHAKRDRDRSVSSSSGDEHSSSRRKKEKRKDKDGKRNRSRERKREKKREKKEKKRLASGSAPQWGKYGIISDSDIFLKGPEFYAWLVEERKINPETISKDQNKKEFSKYVEDFNTATLPHEKYYHMEAYERRMSALRQGEFVPPPDDTYDPQADMKAISGAHKKKVVEHESYLSREQLQELRKVQHERIEAGKMKLLGMDVKQNMGVRMDGTMFDG